MAVVASPKSLPERARLHSPAYALESSSRLFSSGVAIIIVPTIALLDQWYVTLQDDFGVSAQDLSTYSGDGTPEHPTRLNLMVLNTARDAAQAVANLIPNALVVDECHRAGSQENSRVLSGQHAAALGLSATPHRDYDDALETIIEPALGSIIYEYGYDQARHDGVITNFELVNVKVDLTADEEKHYDDLSRQIRVMVRRFHEGEDVETRIKKLLRDRAAVSSKAEARIPVSARIVEQHSGKRIIVFHESINAANKIVKLLANRGSRVAAYHSAIGPDIRRDNLRMFRRGQIDVLVTCRALDEGVNVPEASIAIIASSTASSRQRIQRLGRVLRPATDKSKAIVYTIYATKIEEDRLRKESDRLESVDQVTWFKTIHGGGGYGASTPT